MNELGKEKKNKVVHERNSNMLSSCPCPTCNFETGIFKFNRRDYSLFMFDCGYCGLVKIYISKDELDEEAIKKIKKIIIGE